MTVLFEPRTVAVVGATGFCGQPIADRCRRLGLTVRAISRTPSSSGPFVTAALSDTEVGSLVPAAADLRDHSALVTALDGCDTVVLAASYTGRDPQLAWRINRDGAQNLAAAARELGIDDVVYLSTLGIYGAGPYRRRREDSQPIPVTELSRSRLAAEDIVRAAGGTVLRPGFTYGPGPRNFLTGLAHIVTALDAMVDDGAAAQSVLDVTRLAAVTTDLAARPLPDVLRGQALNIADPEPRTVAQLVAEAAEGGLLTPPAERIGLDTALIRAAAAGLSPREIDLIAHEHTLDLSRLQTLGTAIRTAAQGPG